MAWPKKFRPDSTTSFSRTTPLSSTNASFKKGPATMSLMLVLQILRRRIWIVGFTVLTTLIGAVLVMLLVPARYDAVATASIDPSVSDPISGTVMGGPVMMLVQGNLLALAKSNQVALAVVDRLNMDENPEAQAAYQTSP